MATYKVTMNLEQLGYTEEEFFKFIKGSYYEQVIELPKYNFGLRNLITGWKKIGSVADWKPSDGPYEPGTYALVWDIAGNVSHPILSPTTFMFGETTQDMCKRLTHHVGALKGTTSNMSDKYRKHLPAINMWAGENITNHLNKVIMWYRPHDADPADAPFQFDRVHSASMETQAHGYYKAMWGKNTIGNTRDLPSYSLVEKCIEYLTENGYNPKLAVNKLPIY